MSTGKAVYKELGDVRILGLLAFPFISMHQRHNNKMIFQFCPEKTERKIKAHPERGRLHSNLLKQIKQKGTL